MLLEPASVLFLSFIHVGEIIKNPFLFDGFILENIKHFYSCGAVKKVAVFGFSDLLVI